MLVFTVFIELQHIFYDFFYVETASIKMKICDKHLLCVAAEMLCSIFFRCLYSGMDTQKRKTIFVTEANEIFI